MYRFPYGQGDGSGCNHSRDENGGYGDGYNYVAVTCG